MRLVKGKLYRLYWDDINNSNEWTSLDSIFKQVAAIKPEENSWYYLGSVGHWRIFSSGKLNDNKEYFDWTAIPKGVILKMKEMK